MSGKLLEFRANQSNCFVSDIQHAYTDMCICTSLSQLLYTGKLICKSAMLTISACLLVPPQFYFIINLCTHVLQNCDTYCCVSGGGLCNCTQNCGPT